MLEQSLNLFQESYTENLTETEKFFIQQNSTKFDFEKLFYEKNFEEVHNENSMAILGNSLEVLKKFKSNTVDLIFADAPYGIGKNFGNNNDTWKDKFSYIEWCKIWIDECMRVLKNNGTMYLMTATQHMPYIDVYVSEKYFVICRIVWTYDSSSVQSKKIYGSLYEPILMFIKSEKSNYKFNSEDIL